MDELKFEDLEWLFKRPPNITNVKESYREILLLQYKDEARLLWDQAKDTHGDILEIGGNCGGSLALLCAAAGNKRQVVSVDIKDYYKAEIKSFLSTIEANYEILIQDSKIPINRKFGLIFIDSNHRISGVVQDVSVHWSEATDRVLFHDYSSSYSGVVDVVDYLIRKGIATKGWQASSMISLRKQKELSPIDKQNLQILKSIHQLKEIIK
jgi:hypothetical protein